MDGLMAWRKGAVENRRNHFVFHSDCWMMIVIMKWLERKTERKKKNAERPKILVFCTCQNAHRCTLFGWRIRRACTRAAHHRFNGKFHYMMKENASDVWQWFWILRNCRYTVRFTHTSDERHHKLRFIHSTHYNAGTSRYLGIKFIVPISDH